MDTTVHSLRLGVHRETIAGAGARAGTAKVRRHGIIHACVTADRCGAPRRRPRAGL